MPYNPNVKRLITQEIEDIGKPFGDSKDWVPTVEDPSTDFYRIESEYNNNRNEFNKNRFPDSKGFLKWFFIGTGIYEIYDNHSEFYKYLPMPNK